MKILISNVGSTSLKFKLFEMPEAQLICEALVEKIGSRKAGYHFSGFGREEIIKKDIFISSYREGIEMFMGDIMSRAQEAPVFTGDVEAVGFKTVLARGYDGVHELTDEVLRAMEKDIFIAPAHNGPYLTAIKQFKKTLPGVPLIGAFETAFHQTIPLSHRLYAIPYEWYETFGICRKGYHGASFSYIAREACENGRFPRIIGCHLGGSSSVCAILKGQSFDSSFGFSLQTGIPHGSRCGDTDAFVVPFLRNEGMKEEEILEGLGSRGGLYGISGVSSDFREIEIAAGKNNERAKLAIEVFVNGIVKYIGAFYAEMGGLDKLVFTGGIGENSSHVREEICRRIQHLGLRLDQEANQHQKGKRYISCEDSQVKVQVIPACEELGIAWQTYEMVAER